MLNLEITKPLVTDLNIGDGATLCGWSDRTAATVIARTAKSITVQEDTATLLNGYNSEKPDALKFFPGGFCGHTSGTQRYSYTADPEGIVSIARLRKNGTWITKSGKTLIVGRHHFYDFNF